MKYDKLIKSEIYGFPLYYRIENRKEPRVRSAPESEPKCESNDTLDAGVNLENTIIESAERGVRPTLIISYRKEINGVLHMLYEGQPISGREIVTWLGMNEIDCPSLDDLPSAAKKKFLDEFIGIDQTSNMHKKATKGRTETLLEQREVNLQRRKDLKELTLGILLTVDVGRLDLSDSDKPVAKKLILKEGKRMWQDALPENFLWLVESSEHERKAVKRVMTKFFRMQNEAGICEENPWLDYDACAVQKKKQSNKAYIKKYVEVISLTRQRSSLIFEKCRERLKNGSVSGLDIAVLLMLTLKMDEQEISALYLEDFKYLDFFKNRLSVKVTHRAEKVEKRYTRSEISDPYERRQLPVISLVKECWEHIRKEKGIHLGSKSQHPLVPSKQNMNRRETPDKLIKVIEEYVSSIDGMELRRVTDFEGISLPRVSNLLKTTAYQQMLDVHLEEEEIRAILGKHPRRVSGKHYYDRFNDAAINKIGVLLDKWTSIADPAEMAEPVNGTYGLSAKKKLLKIQASNTSHRVQAIINVSLRDVAVDCLPEEGIELEVFSPGGMSGTVSFIKNQGGRNGQKQEIWSTSNTQSEAVLEQEQRSARQPA